MAAEYHFITHWKIKGTAREVADVLGDPLSLVRWWPSVYLEVRELDAGDPVTHVGRVIDLYTKGWLPYTLRWRFKVTESRGVDGFTLVADGDFVGTGVWTFVPIGEFVDVKYDWRIRADKALLRYGSFIFRPSYHRGGTRGNSRRAAPNLPVDFATEECHSPTANLLSWFGKPSARCCGAVGKPSTAPSPRWRAKLASRRPTCRRSNEVAKRPRRSGCWRSRTRSA